MVWQALQNDTVSLVVAKFQGVLLLIRNHMLSSSPDWSEVDGSELTMASDLGAKSRVVLVGSSQVVLILVA